MDGGCAVRSRDTAAVQIPPPTSYARRGSASIAYQAFGEGPPVLVSPTAPSHLDLMWIDPGYTQVLRRLGGFAYTVIFDARGLGLSDPLDHVPTVEECADDLEAVMDAARVERAVLLAMGTAYRRRDVCCSRARACGGSGAGRALGSRHRRG